MSARLNWTKAPRLAPITAPTSLDRRADRVLNRKRKPKRFDKLDDFGPGLRGLGGLQTAHVRAPKGSTFRSGIDRPHSERRREARCGGTAARSRPAQGGDVMSRLAGAYLRTDGLLFVKGQWLRIPPTEACAVERIGRFSRMWLAPDGRRMLKMTHVKPADASGRGHTHYFPSPDQMLERAWPVKGMVATASEMEVAKLLSEAARAAR